MAQRESTEVYLSKIVLFREAGPCVFVQHVLNCYQQLYKTHVSGFVSATCNMQIEQHLQTECK